MGKQKRAAAVQNLPVTGHVLSSWVLLVVQGLAVHVQSCGGYI